MASLSVLKGATPGQRVTVDGERFVLGRNPDCGLVIPITSVSREHAQIVQMGGKCYIEDLQSRNGTKVNNQVIAERTLLKNNDVITICDFQAQFQDGAELPPLPPELLPEQPEEEEPEDEPAVVPEITVSGASSHVLLQTQPADKLKALLEITANLSKTLELSPLLPKITDSLFFLFRQADRCFIIQRDEASGKLIPRVTKTRRAHDEVNARFSRSIVKQSMDTLQALLLDDASSDSRFAMAQSVADFRIRSVMCAPLITAEGQAFGVIQLDTQDRSKKFTEDDLKLLVGVASQASVALENARLHEAAVSSAKLKRDLELAQQVQRSFLPKGLPQVAGYEFFAYYEAAQAVGGDYYDFIPLPDGKLAVMVGDVAGKGVPASLLMAKLSSDARFCSLTESDLATVVARLNDLLYEHTSQMDRFVTLAAAVLDPTTNTVTMASAGHPSPLLYVHQTRQAADAMPRRAAGLPLGMMEAQTFDVLQVKLEPGDFLILFSDGVPDSYSVANTAFGNEGVYSALADGGPHVPSTAGDRIVKAIARHAAGRAPHDDVTLVCFGRTS